MKLKYYFGASVIAASGLVSAVILGWIGNSAAAMATVAIPLFLIGSAAAWFLDTLDRRLSEISLMAGRLTAEAAPAAQRRSNDDTVSVIAQSLDSVQRRMADLQSQLDQQRAVAEHAIDAMWVLNVEAACIIDVNQSFVALSGYPREQLIGMPLSRLEPTNADGSAQSEAAQLRLVARALAGERVVTTTTLLRRDGTRVPCELRAAKLPSLPGRTLIGGIIIDISDRLRQQQSISERLAVEALISKLSTDMIHVQAADIDQGIIHALAQIGQLLQADRGTVFQLSEARDAISLTHEWCAPGASSTRLQRQNRRMAQFAWSRARLQGGELLHVPRVADLPDEAATEREAWRGNGIRSIVLVPLRARPSVPGFVSFEWLQQESAWTSDFVFALTMFGEMISNLLTRQRVDRALDDQRDALERSIGELTRSNSELQRFAYAASHDLQEPLRAISGFSDLLARRYRGRLDATADEYLDFVRDAVVRMRAMIINLLDYSRIDASPRPFEPCDLNRVLRMAQANLHASIEELDAHIDAESLPTVMGDPAQLLQLLQNLLGNAMKFHADAQPLLRIRAERLDAEWQISVRDNGIGIRSEDSERVFEVFKRLHAADRYPGSGIGLSVCKRIIERHRGRIWAQPNDDGIGVTFRFTLPVMEA